MKSNELKVDLISKYSPVLQWSLRLLCGWLLLNAVASLAATFDADIRPDFRTFSPTLLNPGDHPTSLRFDIYNAGFDGATNDVDVEILLSRDNTFGNADDVAIGQISVFVVLPVGRTTNVIFDAFNPSHAAILAGLTIPSSACGYYTNMYMVVTFPQGSDFTDTRAYPVTLNNVDSVGFPSHVFNQIGPAPTVDSITRLTPADDTTDASSVTWQVAFSDAVTGVNSSDFTLTRVSGSLSGYALTSLQQPSEAVVNVTANTGSGSGELRLDMPNNPSIYSVCEVRMTTGFVTVQVV